MYKLAIFDFDGTLVDSAPGIVEIMKLVISDLELPGDILEQWSHLVGVPLPRQVETLFPEKDGDYHDKIVSHYRTLYDGNNIKNCPLFPGLIEVLEGLKKADIAISIATSKRRHLVLGVLDHHDLSKYFRLVVGAQEVTNHKPHPESVHTTLSQLEINPAEAIVIGDSFYDLEMARLAGVDAIGVTTGIHTRETLTPANPKHIVTSLEQVLPIILYGRKEIPGKT